MLCVCARARTHSCVYVCMHVCVKSKPNMPSVFCPSPSGKKCSSRRRNKTKQKESVCIKVWISRSIFKTITSYTHSISMLFHHLIFVSYFISSTIVHTKHRKMDRRNSHVSQQREYVSTCSVNSHQNSFCFL